MSTNGQPPAAPVFPWELVLRNSTVFFEPIQGGGMVLAVCPVAASEGGGATMMPPMIRVVFGPDGWQAFAAKVAADGGRSAIQIARALPPEPPAA